jgi:hypothetical protein
MRRPVASEKYYRGVGVARSSGVHIAGETGNICRTISEHHESSSKIFGLNRTTFGSD